MNKSHVAFLFGPDDPMNFLHPNDRLAAVLTKKANPMNIPVFDVQKQMDENLQDQIETLHLQILDLEDALQIARDHADRLERRNGELQLRLSTNAVLMNERNAAVARCTSLESDVKRLNADLKTEVGNRNHFRSLVAQQDAFIKEAKRQIEEFKRKKEEELKSKASEAEHLAKQVLKLKAENDKYVGIEYSDLKKVNDQLNAQTPILLEENRKFKEQTTRLIEEKRKLEEELLAERKFSLQLDEKLTRRDEELSHEQNVTMYRWQMIELLTKALQEFKSWPCLRPFAKGKLMRATGDKLKVLQAEVERLRKEFHKI